VFGLQHSQSGWAAQILYSFGANESDGLRPDAGVVVDSTGHLYGATPIGGYGRGTIFELTYSPSGWKEKILHYFEGGYDGTTPYAGLTLDGAGNLYGTTSSGGANNQGTVFELSPSAQGWTETIIYNFASFQPSRWGLQFDQLGSLHGESRALLYELSPSNGGWTENTFFTLTNGDNATGGLLFDSAGNTYGTAQTGGGVFNAGVVFEITP